MGGASGVFVGLLLGLIGGGGSILAVPLMIYVVGLPNAHLAIGTSALAVASNAAAGLLLHARGRRVEWRCGALYAISGSFGALFGSYWGRLVDSEKLLGLFALLMIVVAALMLRDRSNVALADAAVRTRRTTKILSCGMGTGLCAGFFGIGGGFLVVPGLIASTGMPMINAVATSLLAVTAFGLTTALSYAVSGLIDWPLALLFVVGGAFGALIGVRMSLRLAHRNTQFKTIFSGVLFIVATYMLWRSAISFRLDGS